jgi:putative SbcD/Mre11-related phosphoesterase
MAVEPIHGTAAAVVEGAGEQLLVVADYHAGIEVALRTEGVELPSGAADRRERLLGLIERTEADRLVVLGDLGHTIGESGRLERDELFDLFAALPDDIAVTIVKGNHDGEVELVLEDVDHDVAVTSAAGTRMGSVGFAHGHTWPRPAVLAADVVCVGHEHPVVRLEDEVGGHRTERVWLRGSLAAAPFEAYHEGLDVSVDGELVVFPAFNELSGGTWVNVADRDFLAPFLPGGLDHGQAYLLDGTRLGAYRGL